MSLHAYRSIARARAAAPIATRRGSSARSDVDRGGEHPGIVRHDRDRGLRRRHLAIPGNVRRDHGQGAGERTGQHHAEALAPERRRHERLRPRRADPSAPPGRGSRGCRCPSSGTRSRVSRSLTARGSAPQIWSRAPLRRWISGQARSRTCSPFRVSCRPANVTVCSRPRGIDGVGDEDAVRDDLVVAGKPPCRRVAGPLGDGDPLVDPAREEPPGRHRRASSSRARPRRGGWRPSGGRHREHRDAGHGRHRLVQVEHVEALPLEHPPDPEDRARAEDDVRQRAVRGHDHRPADRDHVRRRVAVPADAGVEGARELTGGSLPITSRTSCPRASSASACSSACSTTAPQNDHENGTTMPIFTRGA